MRCEFVCMKTAILLGASGLIGKQLLGQLLDSPHYQSVVALVRKPLNWKHAKLTETLFDFDNPNPALLQGDDLYCCLGTTARKAGSQESQRKVDYTYPLELGKLAKAQGVQQYILVSSVGANADSSNFYLKTKGQLERDLATLGFNTLIIVRPSILLGARQEFRLGEQIGIGMAKLFGAFMQGRLKKYRAIEAKQVAKAMLALAQKEQNGVVIAESDELADIT